MTEKQITPENIRSYLSRSWGMFEQVATASWKKRLESGDSKMGLEVGDALWRQAKRMHPDWPSDADRKEDLEAHVRLKEIFCRIHAAWGKEAAFFASPDS